MLDRSLGRSRELRHRLNHWRKLQKARNQKILLLVMYHRILPEVSFDPFRTIVSSHTLERQLEILSQEYTVCSLRDAVESPINDDILVALTFDDGYEDNYRYAFPVLKKNGLSATFLVVTQQTTNQRPLWDWNVICRICVANIDLQEIKIGSIKLSKGVNEDRPSFALRIIEHLKGCSLTDLEGTLAQLAHQSENETINTLLASGRTMSWEQLNIMKENGMEIGAHSVSHRSLARLPFSEAVTEIVESKQEIENKLQTPCLHFAFPFGTLRDHNPSLIDAVKSAGFRTCLLARHGLNVITPNLFCLNRITIYEKTDVRYLLG